MQTSAVTPIFASTQSIPTWKDKLPERANVQSGLLVLTTIAAILSMIPPHKTNSRFTITNDSDQKMNIFDRNGKLIRTIQPGEKAEFEVPFIDTKRHQVYQDQWDDHRRMYVKVLVNKGSYVDVIKVNSSASKLDAYTIDTETRIDHAPMEPKDFPTAPIGSTVVAGPDVVNHKSVCDRDYESADVKFDLTNLRRDVMPCFLRPQ